jgi:3-phosphoshikimate 1-carboxyvinyltransferase
MTVAAMLTALGADVEEGEDFLLIHGCSLPLQGGVMDGAGDHRIVMSGAVSAMICKDPVTIIGTQAVNKSYPGFFEEREKLL